MKTMLYLLLTLLFFTATSCEVDVPDMDRVPPKFSLQINGDGFNHTFTEADDLSNVTLNLRKGYEYKFTLLGSDAGGLQELLLIWEDELVTANEVNIPNGLPEGWYETNHYDHSFEFYPFVDSIRFQGDASDAYTGAGVSGTFSFSSYALETYSNLFEIVARDYGGLSGEPNITTQHLKLYIGNRPTALVTRD